MNGPLRDDEQDLLRTRLEERLRVLRSALDLARAAAHSERIGQYSGEVYDRGEESSVDAAAEVNGALIDQQQAELRAVRAAIARLDDGSYGECVDCGGEVGAERLRASPSAARCIPCQSRAERD
jgi:RNA polymerase-binding transcription factor DksA